MNSKVKNSTGLILLLLSSGAFSQNSGMRYFASGDYQNAKIHFAKQLENSPEDADLIYHYGRTHFEMNNTDQAIDYLSKAIELDDSHSEYHFWLGEAYLQKLENGSMFEKMRAAGNVKDNYKRAVELDPNNITAREALTNFYFQAPGIAGGSMSEAKKHANIVISQDPRRGHSLMADLYAYDEEYELARQEIMKLSTIEEDKEKIHYKLGRMYQDAEQYDKAFEAFEKSMTYNSNYGPSYYQFARTGVFAEQQIDKAISYMQKYLTLPVLPNEPDLSSANWRLGMLYEIKGQPKQARMAYETALKLDPNNKSARSALDKLD